MGTTAQTGAQRLAHALRAVGLRLRRRAWLWIPLAGMLLTLPALGTELLLDDFVHATLVTDRLEGRGGADPWWNIFSWAGGDQAAAQLERWHGVRPWWASVHARVEFFRPLAAATHYLDYGLWPSAFWAMHLQSVLWYGLACFAVVLIGMRLTSSASVGLLAGLLYALDDAHVAPAGWLAARNGTMSAALGLLALYCYDRAQRDGWRVGAWLSPVCMALALLAGETAVAVLPMFPLLRLLRPSRFGPWLRSLMPVLSVSLLWVTAYKWLGQGAHVSGAYIDPIAQPLLFARSAVPRARELLTLHFGSSWVLTEPLGVFWVGVTREVGIYLIVPSVLVVAIRRFDQSGPIRFWVAASVCALLPALSAAPHDRLLCVAGACMWMLAAEAAVALWRGGAARALPSRAFVGVLLGGAAAMHLVLSPLGLAHGVGPKSEAAAPFSGARVMAGHEPARDLATKELVVVNAPDGLHSRGIVHTHQQLGLPAPAATLLLGTTRHEVHVTREDRHTLTLYTPIGYLEGHLSNVWRSPAEPLGVGEAVRVRGFTATVLRRTFDHRPLEVRFRFDRPLDDPQLRFVYWSSEHYVELPLPPIGHTRLIRDTFGFPP